MKWLGLFLLLSFTYGSFCLADAMASQNIENFFGSISYAPKVLRLTEQPSADMLKNRPPNLRISHLRRLREDGYFEFEEPDVQKAAYFISKLIWEEAELSSFCDIITWERFCKAKPRVDKIIRKTWPERFNRIKIAHGIHVMKKRTIFKISFVP